jgi:hypothetical protein
MTETGRYQSGRCRQIEADREAGRRRPGSWAASHRFDEGAEDAPQADHGANRSWERARVLARGRCRCHDGCDWHRPRRGDTGPPSGEQPGRHRQRDAHTEGLAGKLIADRYRAAQHGCASECDRRAQQRTIRIRPHAVPPASWCRLDLRLRTTGIDLKGGSTTALSPAPPGEGRTGKPQTGAIDAHVEARHATRHLAIGGDFRTLGQQVTITSRMLFDPGEARTLMTYRPGSGAYSYCRWRSSMDLLRGEAGAVGGAADAELAGPVGVLSPTLLVWPGHQVRSRLYHSFTPA